MKCRELITYLEEICDPEYACSWDNVGLLLGRKEKEVNTILLSLDCNDKAIEFAIKNQVDLVLSHHQLIFKGMKRITDDYFVGEKILTLAENKIACVAMHTNFDIVGGMAPLAAKQMGFSVLEPLEVTDEQNGIPVGIGTVSKIEPQSLKDLIVSVKKNFSLDYLMVYGDDFEKEVNTVAISPGSGRSMIEEAVNKKVDVLITGDIGHHEGLDAKEQDLIVIDAGHYGLEHIFISYMENMLMKKYDNRLNILTYYDGSPFRIV